MEGGSFIMSLPINQVAPDKPRSQTIIQYLQLTVGGIIGALSVAVFLIPANVVPAGVSGLAVIINEIFGLPVGVMTLVLNIPLMFLAYRMLPGGWRMVARTIFVVAVYSLGVDVLSAFVTEPYTDDRLLNTIFGGIVGGISGGLVYRTGSNFGGTSILGLIIQRRTGTPLSTTSLYTDTLIIALAGAVFGVEGALYAMIVLFLGGVAADYVMEGPSVVRMAFVITDKPDEVAQAVMRQLQRGVTLLPARGMYTGQDRPMLYVTVTRSQVKELKAVIIAADDRAFIVIGQGHSAYGGGFRTVGKASHNSAVPAQDNVLPSEAIMEQNEPETATTPEGT